MSRLKIFLLVLACAPMLVYGGVKGYAYFTVRSQVQEMIRLVSPFVEVSYGGIGSSFDGTFSVEDVRVQPRELPEAIRIDALQLHTPGLWFLVDGHEIVRREGFPERLGASVRGLHLDLGGRLMAELISHSEDLTRGGSPRADGLACGWRKLFTPESFRDLGYAALSYDIDLLLLRPGQGDEVEMRFESRAHNLHYFQLAIRLVGIADALVGDAAGGLRMKSLSVRYGLDPGYVGKALDHCAQQSDLGVETLLQRLSGQDDDAYMADLGFVPGEGIRSALVDYFLQPGEFQLTAHPPWAVGLDTLQRYKPQDWPGRLNLSVSVDQKKISDLSFSRVSVGAADREGNRSTYSSEPQSGTRKSGLRDRGSRAGTLRRGGYYQSVGKEQLPDLLGRDIWLVTDTGLERQGRLVKVEDGVVWLTLRLRGGSMTTSVALAQARQVELRARRH